MTPLQISVLTALICFAVAVGGDVPYALRWLRDERTIWCGWRLHRLASCSPCSSLCAPRLRLLPF